MPDPAPPRASEYRARISHRSASGTAGAPTFATRPIRASRAVADLLDGTLSSQPTVSWGAAHPRRADRRGHRVVSRDTKNLFHRVVDRVSAATTWCDASERAVLDAASVVFYRTFHRIEAVRWNGRRTT
jgi:hypothetical protein